MLRNGISANGMRLSNGLGVNGLMLRNGLHVNGLRLTDGIGINGFRLKNSEQLGDAEMPAHLRCSGCIALLPQVAGIVFDSAGASR